ncbi:MAG: hypothetical protein FK734_13210 [Asgard group archaeon]|nr:hypothetical protein [Asgard group archaeon]
MKNSEIAIGSWVGKDITNVLTIQFYNTQHIPFRIKNTGEVLLENSGNNLFVISNNLLDNPINRLDYNLSVKFDSHPELVNNYNPPITLQLNVYAIEENQVDDYLLINVSSGSNIIQHIILPVTIAKELDISLILPAEPILSREFPNKEAYFTIKFSNIFDFNINYNISSVQVSEASDAYNQTLDGVVAPDLTKEIDFAVTIDYQKNSYVSFLEVYMNSTVGSYIIDTEITIRPTNQFITNDLIIILFSVIGVSFLSFILLLLYFKAITKSKIKNHIEKDETLELDLKLLENYAIKELYNEYIDSKNWGYGLKLCDEYLQGVSVRFHDMRAKDLLLKGQKEASDGKFHEALMNWEGAKESLEVIGEHQWLDTIDWLLEPLQKIVEIKQSMKGDKKAGALQKEFNVLSGMQEQDKSIMGISLSIPLFIIAEELGLAYKDVNDLQNSLTYLQFAYQYAPDKMKSKIIQEITALIGLGVVPRELAVPIDQKVVQERLASRKIRCYNCGEERTNVKDVCPNCGLETITCSVCKLPITFGAETSQCPSCENIAHREHLLEWTKVKGSCPICQAPLKTVDIDKSSSEVENVE